MLKSIKFGGPTMGNESSLENAVNLILLDSSRRLISVSAPVVGELRVTKMLEEAADEFMLERRYPKNIVSDIREIYSKNARHSGVDTSFLDGQFQWLYNTITSFEGDHDSYRARVKLMGERIQARLFKEILRAQGLNAVCLYPERIGLKTDDNFENAKPLLNAYELVKSNLAHFLEDESLYMVFPGFGGVNERNQPTTFKYGGTDLTAAFFAAALGADVCEICKDNVDGVLRADPRLIPEAETVPDMTYREQAEYGAAGAEVVLYDAIKPLVSRNIPLVVMNTNKPNGPKTTVKNNGAEYRGITGIASKNTWVFSVEKGGAENELGFGSHLTGIFTGYGISYSLSIESEAMVNVLVDFPPERSGSLDETRNLMGIIENQIRNSTFLKPDRVNLYEHGVITVVAEGLNKLKKAYMLEKALAEAGEGIPILRSSQGSDISRFFVVNQSDTQRAVRALYDISKQI